jgi:hypothetical protein
MRRHVPDKRRCEAHKGDQPCGAWALRKPDPDGAWRCYHHSQCTELAAHRDKARAVGAYLVTSQKSQPRYESYDTVEKLEGAVDDLINDLRANRRRPQVATAILQAVEARRKIAETRLLAMALGKAAALGDPTLIAAVATNGSIEAAR